MNTLFRTIHPIRATATRWKDFRKQGLRRYFVVYGEACVASCSSDWSRIRPSYYVGDEYYKYWYVYNRCFHVRLGALFAKCLIQLCCHKKYDYILIKSLRSKKHYPPFVRRGKLDYDCLIEEMIKEL